MFKKRALLILVLAFFAHGAEAQFQISGGGGGRSKAVTGALSAGLANFNALNPSSDVRMNPGQFVSLSGEKGFGIYNLYLEAMVTYLKASGDLDYSFIGSDSQTYETRGVNYKSDNFQGDLGLRAKILDGVPFRPYLEGGLSAGYMQFTYDQSIATTFSPIGNGFKNIDSALDFGTYGELGIEADIIDHMGVKFAWRYQDSTTRTLETLKRQSLRYAASIFYLGAFATF